MANSRIVRAIFTMAIALFVSILTSTTSYADLTGNKDQVALNTQEGRQSLFTQANAFIDQKQWGNAIADLRLLVTNSPDNACYQESLSIALGCLVASGQSINVQADCREAVTHYKITLKLNPSRERDPGFLLYFSKCLAETGQMEDAKKYTQEGIDIAPEGSKVKEKLVALKAKL